MFIVLRPTPTPTQRSIQKEIQSLHTSLENSKQCRAMAMALRRLSSSTKNPAKFFLNGGSIYHMVLLSFFLLLLPLLFLIFENQISNIMEPLDLASIV